MRSFFQRFGFAQEVLRLAVRFIDNDSYNTVAVEKRRLQRYAKAEENVKQPLVQLK